MTGKPTNSAALNRQVPQPFSRHLLPACKGMIAVLGAGNNLNWLRATWLPGRRLAYWGDLDTWGLRLLAQARGHQPDLAALLMDQATFATAAHNAVIEPTTAPRPELGLTPNELRLFKKIAAAKAGRLEQEFLPEAHVRKAIMTWHRTSPAPVI